MPDHHELPRYYLRGFCEPETSFIWVFDKTLPYRPGTKHGNNPRRTGIRRTALRPDGYAAWTRDGTRHFEYERELQRKERIADDVIRRVREFDSLAFTDKNTLARYIGLMWRRIRARESEMLPVLDRQLAGSTLEKEAWRLALQGKVDDARAVLDELEWLRSKHGRTFMLRESMIVDFHHVHAAFLRMFWTFHRPASGRYFVTGDIPVIYDRFLGLRASPLLFPLSRDVLLVATWYGADDRVWRETSPEETLKLNSMIITTATSHVYASVPAEWIHRGLIEGFTFTAGVGDA